MENTWFNNVNATVKNDKFQNRAEFIKASLRDKVDDVKLKEVMLEVSKIRGKSKIKTTDAERERVREEVFREFEKKFR